MNIPSSSTSSDTFGTYSAAQGVRDRSMDVLKGIGMVIIVMGHTDYRGIGGSFVTYLYTFNVALFFIVSGYMWKPREGESFLRTLSVKFRQIYVPYLVLFWVSIGYGYFIVKYVFGQYVIPFEWKPTLKAMLFSSEWLNSVPTFNFALWFLPIFFIASVAFQLLQKLYKRKAYYFAVVLLIAVSVPVQTLLPGRPILNINVLPVALSLMALGYLLRRFAPSGHVSGWVVFGCLGLTLLVALLVPGNVSRITEYWFFPAAIASFVVYRHFAQLLQGSDFLNFIGRNSLLIFGLHGLVANTYQYTVVSQRVGAHADGLLAYLINVMYVVVITSGIVWTYLEVKRLVKNRVIRS